MSTTEYASKKAYIYALVDPRDSRIYYVGSSVNPEDRLIDHLFGVNQVTLEKKTWIDDLKSHKTRPILVILERVNRGRAIREKYWIELLVKLGAPLTNSKLSTGKYRV